MEKYKINILDFLNKHRGKSINKNQLRYLSYLCNIRHNDGSLILQSGVLSGYLYDEKIPYGIEEDKVKIREKFIVTYKVNPHIFYLVSYGSNFAEKQVKHLMKNKNIIFGEDLRIYESLDNNLMIINRFENKYDYLVSVPFYMENAFINGLRHIYGCVYKKANNIDLKK